MIKINLLPYREQAKKESAIQEVYVFAGAFLLFLLGIVWFHIWMQSSVSNLETKVTESEKKLVELDKKIGDVEKFKKVKQELEQKLGVIDNLEENRLAPVKTLDSFAMIVPAKDIWIVKLTQKEDRFTIDGIGRDNIAVAAFMKDVENFNPIKSVDLVSSKKTEMAGLTLQQFIFSCVLKKGF